MPPSVPAKTPASWGLDLLQCAAGDNEESPKRKNRFREPTKSNGADAKYRMMDCVTSR